MSHPESASATVARPRRELATILVVIFIDLLGFGIIVPVLPFYVRSFGVSDVYIGLLAASYSLLQFGFAPVLGRLSDRRGRRPVLLLSLAGSALAWTVFGIAAEIAVLAGTAVGVVTLFLSRMLAGAMGGNVATAQAYIADVTPPERRAGALGLVGGAFSMGFVFGPAVGGLLASEPVVAAAREVLPAFVPATRFSLPSFAAAGLSLASLAVGALFLREPDRQRRGDGNTTLVGQFREALAAPALRVVVIAFFLLSVAFSGVQVMFIPFVADVYGFDETQTALLISYIGVLGALNQGVVVGRLSRRLPSERVAVLGATLLVGALAALPFSPTIGRAVVPAGPSFLTPELSTLLAVGAVLSLGNALLGVSLATLVSTAASADRQGSAFGVTQGAASLGRTVGPPAMAALYVMEVWSPFVAGALLLVPVALALFARSQMPWRVRGRL